MTSPVGFLKETQDELKKMVWPTQKEVVRLTVTVTVFSVIVGLFIGAMDYLFVKGLELLVK